MLLGKTDKARAALQARSPALNAMDRRLLILSDGERSRDSLLAMFGADVGASIDRLVREVREKPGGFLELGTCSGAEKTLAAELVTVSADDDPVRLAARFASGVLGSGVSAAKARRKNSRS